MIVGEVLLGDLAQLWLEGGREEQKVMVSILVCVFFKSVTLGSGYGSAHTPSRHDLANFFLPVRRDQLVSFIENGVSMYSQRGS